ncbi:unnamed protein product [Didymodactylos carnosus]|nr:unnamed protein product [Didymodactylos carnosus]CAF3661100.1 unnamed protein product [Didymodactylos carnosus]
MGCGSSRSGNRVNPNIDLISSSTHIQIPTTIPSSEDPAKNKEDVSILWYGTPSDTARIALQSTNNFLQVFRERDNGECCITYMKKIETEKVVLIISASHLTRYLIVEVKALRHVDSVFILTDRNANEITDFDSYINDCPKIKIFAKLHDMINYTNQCVKLMLKQAVEFSVFDQKQKSTRDLTRDAASFLWFQVLLSVLQRMPKSESSEHDMLEFCRRYYKIRNNHNELGNIELFRTQCTKPEDAINWYTKECFIYKLINKALRTEDINSLIMFRSFLVDLCGQLQSKHLRRIDSGDTSVMVLYRAQQISKTEIIKIKGNINNLISTNGFLSTTRDIKLAKQFLSSNKLHNPDLVPLLFEIQAPSNLNKVIFSDISDLSQFPEEQEVLFSIGAVFKLDAVEDVSINKYVQIKMTATDEGSENVDTYIDLTRKDAEETDITVLFGRLLIDMGKYQEAERYFKQILSSRSNEDYDMAAVYHNLGRAHGYKGELKEAENNFSEAYNRRKRNLPIDHIDVLRTQNSIGVIYGENGEYDKALKKFTDALNSQKEILARENNQSTTLNLHIAMSYSNIGWVNYLKGEYVKAHESHNAALEIRRTHLPEDHPLFADNYSSVGAIYHAQGKYKEALEYHNRALRIREQKLPSHHPSIANSYQSIGGVEHENGRYERALDFYNRALNIRMQTLASDHSSMASNLRSIGGVYLDEGNYMEALQHYQQALYICQKSFKADHPSVGDCLHNIGMVKERQGVFQDAIKYYAEALEISYKCLPNDHPSTAKILSSLANVYLRQRNYDISLQHYTHVYRIQQSSLITNQHPDIALTLNNLGVLHRYKADYGKAADYFTKALQMCEKCFPENHPAVSRTLSNMGDMYLASAKYDKALEYYKRAESIRLGALLADDLGIADIYYNMGCVYYNKESFVEALPYFIKCKRTYEKKYHRDHVDIRRVENSIMLVKAAMQEIGHAP